MGVIIHTVSPLVLAAGGGERNEVWLPLGPDSWCHEHSADFPSQTPFLLDRAYRSPISSQEPEKSVSVQQVMCIDTSPTIRMRFGHAAEESWLVSQKLHFAWQALEHHEPR